MSYIETATRYEKVMENGKIKKVTERYLVDALSCTEAESRIVEELTPYVSGDLEVTANKKVNIASASRQTTKRLFAFSQSSRMKCFHQSANMEHI